MTLSKQTTPFEIELAKPGDLPQIWELYQRVWLETYPNEAAGVTRRVIEDYLAGLKENFWSEWEKAILNPGDKSNYRRAVFVARQNDKAIGIISPKIKDDGTHRLTGLYIAPGTRSQGLGSRLIEQGLAWHGDQDVYLYVAYYLEGPQRLYRRFGFEVNRERPEPTFDEGSPIPHLEMVRQAPN